jgi:hypothetical protein
MVLPVSSVEKPLCQKERDGLIFTTKVVDLSILGPNVEEKPIQIYRTDSNYRHP